MKGRRSCLPTSRKATLAALASTRQEIQTIQAIGRIEEKYAYFMTPETLLNSIEYSRNTTTITPNSGHTIKKEAHSSGNKQPGNTVKFHLTTEEVNNISYHDAPIPIKKKVQKQTKILRVTRIFQFLHKRNAFMGLTA